MAFQQQPRPRKPSLGDRIKSILPSRRPERGGTIREKGFWEEFDTENNCTQTPPCLADDEPQREHAEEHGHETNMKAHAHNDPRLRPTSSHAWPTEKCGKHEVVSDGKGILGNGVVAKEESKPCSIAATQERFAGGYTRQRVGPTSTNVQWIAQGHACSDSGRPGQQRGKSATVCKEPAISGTYDDQEAAITIMNRTEPEQSCLSREKVERADLELHIPGSYPEDGESESGETH